MRSVAVIAIFAAMEVGGIAYAQHREEADGRTMEWSAAGMPAARNQLGQIDFRPGSMNLRTGKSGTEFGYRLRRVEAGDGPQQVGSNRMSGSVARVGESVVYPRFAGVQEMYRVTEDGLTQVFQLDPGMVGDAEQVSITGEIDGPLRANPGQYTGGVSLEFGSTPIMQYGPAIAVDASGQQFPVEIIARENELTLTLSREWMRAAAQPVRVEAAIRTLHSSSMLSAKSAAASTEDMPVWRVQVRLYTAPTENAGTDDSIRILLNSANSTWIDYPRNDFEQGDIYYYDLSLTGVTRLRDITSLTMQKNGSNGWRLRSLVLYVNGAMIYSADFGAGRWFDNNSTDTRTLSISSTALRQHPAWLAYVAPLPPSVLPSWELNHMILATHGNAMTGRDYFWGGNGFGKTSVTTQTIAFDWQYRKDVTLFPDYDLSQVYIAKLGCQDGKSFLNMVFSSAQLASWTNPGNSDNDFQLLAESRIVQALRAKLDAIILAMNLGSGCPVLTTGSQGGIGIARP